MNSIKVGQQIEVACDTLDDNGAGVASVDGGVLHVAGALPRERVLATVEHMSSHRPEAWARLDVLREPSPDRVPASCAAFGACGGCVVQHLAYPAQLDWKREQVARALPSNISVDPCVGSPKTLGYRNQAKYVVGRDTGGALVLGAYAPRSHRIVDLAGCRVVEPPIDAVARTLREVLQQNDVAPFDETARTGLLRYAMLRANAGGQVLVTLVTARAEWLAGPQIARALRAASPEVVGVVQNVNPTLGNVLFGDTDVVLDGALTLDDEIEDVSVRLSSRSFFQANRDVAALAYRAIRAAGQRETKLGRVVDAYCGVGGIAFAVAALADDVIGIEQNASATSDGQAAATRAGLVNVSFRTGDAGPLLSEIGAADMVILNPPRAGCAPPVLDAVGKMRPGLVAYLSCNPVTLARDLAALAARGLKATAITPFDMLPHTPHVEVLAIVSAT